MGRIAAITHINKVRRYKAVRQR